MKKTLLYSTIFTFIIVESCQLCDPEDKDTYNLSDSDLSFFSYYKDSTQRMDLINNNNDTVKFISSGYMSYYYNTFCSAGNCSPKCDLERREIIFSGDNGYEIKIMLSKEYTDGALWFNLDYFINKMQFSTNNWGGGPSVEFNSLTVNGKLFYDIYKIDRINSENKTLKMYYNKEWGLLYFEEDTSKNWSRYIY